MTKEKEVPAGTTVETAVWPWQKWLAKNVYEIDNPMHSIYYVQHVTAAGAHLVHRQFGKIFLDNYQVVHFREHNAGFGGVSGAGLPDGWTVEQTSNPDGSMTATYTMKAPGGKPDDDYKITLATKTNIGKKIGRKTTKKAKKRSGSRKKK